MNPINILFFALASIIGMEDARIVSRKVSVTLNPVDKTFEIHQEDLFSILMLPDDRVMAANELQYILEFQKNPKQENANGLVVEEIVLSRKDQQLNATIRGSYIDPKVLAEAGIYFDSSGAGEFSMMHIPEWNIQFSGAILQENYWTWPAAKSVTIVIAPFENIPEEYSKYRTSILPYWER